MKLKIYGKICQFNHQAMETWKQSTALRHRVWGNGGGQNPPFFALGRQPGLWGYFNRSGMVREVV